MVDGTVGAIDNSGGNTKKVDTSELTVGSNTVERQRIVIANSANPTAFATNFPAGFLRVTDEPTQLFQDLFDNPVAAIDTTVRWNTSLASGGGVAASVSLGNMTIGSNTTANGYATLNSQPSFTQSFPGFLGVSFGIQIENPVTVNGYRFWGLGSMPAASAAPVTTAPLTDATGFEVYTDGKLYAVVYAGGTRTVVQDMSSATGNSTQPSDGLFHRYIIYIRADRSFWYIDQLDTVAATASFVAPQVQTLPIRFMTIAGATPPVSSCVITCTGLSAWDTGKNNHSISDGTYGFRKATVSATGALGVDPSLGGPIQGSDGIRQHAIGTDQFGNLSVDFSDVVELLHVIRDELTCIRIQMATLTREEITPNHLNAK